MLNPPASAETVPMQKSIHAINLIRKALKDVLPIIDRCPIRTAAAKGLSRNEVVRRQDVRNCLAENVAYRNDARS